LVLANDPDLFDTYPYLPEPASLIILLFHLYSVLPKEVRFLI